MSLFIGIPVEIQLAILEMLPRHDLVKITHLCTSLAEVAERILYRTFTLIGSRQSTAECTAQMHSCLRKNGRAAVVRSAVFHVQSRAHPFSKPVVLTIPVSVAGMFENLVDLVFFRSFPYPQEDEALFMDALTRGSPGLKKFGFISTIDTDFLTIDDVHAKTYTSFNYPKGLEQIVWHTYLSNRVHRQLLSFTAASASTLTALTITFSDTYGCGPTELDSRHRKLLGYQFPVLRIFRLGPLSMGLDINGSSSVTKFLAAHPTIEHLSLGSGRWSVCLAALSKSHITATFLPALRVLNTQFVNVAMLAKMAPHTLEQVEKLIVLDCYDYNTEDLEMMYAHTQQQTLPRVITLEFVRGVYGDRDKTRKMSDQLAQMCPNTLNYRLGFLAIDDQIYHHEITEHLSRFPKLAEAVIICPRILSEDNGPGFQSYGLQLPGLHPNSRRTQVPEHLLPVFHHNARLTFSIDKEWERIEDQEGADFELIEILHKHWQPLS